MIGQTNLIAKIDSVIDSGLFPRFTIIQGADGSGKNMLVEHIHNKIGYDLVEVNLTVDDVRNCIRSAYEITVPVIYYFRNADELSPAAKNALLKITEEPPNKAYFLLTLLNENSVADTIRSRAIIYQMEPYKPYELKEFLMKYEDGSSKKIALEVCDTPGEIELLYANGAEKLLSFAEKVIQNVAHVSIANALKIADSIAFADTDKHDKFDLALFWKAVIVCYADSTKISDMDVNELKAMSKIVIATKQCIDMIAKTRGINKRSLFDIWILDVRKILGESDGSN